MPKRVLVLDTSVLCCRLRIPGKETAGAADDAWDYARIDELLKTEEALGSTFVLPIASLIETGNHIVNSNGDRFAMATELSSYLLATANSQDPWAAFSDQSQFWNQQGLADLAENWPTLAAANMTIGDATIKAVADYYATAGFHVQILTGDSGLKAYEPAEPVLIPRRRSKRD